MAKGLTGHSGRLQQIDHRVVKLAIGLIALFMAPCMWLIAGYKTPSISDSYYSPARDYFVGALFAVGGLFLAVKGATVGERRLSLLASICAAVVATCPCYSSLAPDKGSALHFPAAGILFAILAYFCWAFRQRALQRIGPHTRANVRVKIYGLCLAGMVSMLPLAGYLLLNQEAVLKQYPSFIYWIELIGLVSFGISWLTASRTLPIFAKPAERYRLFHSDQEVDVYAVEADGEAYR